MTSLLLTILCSTTIGLLLKYNETRKGNAIIMLAGNYFIAAGISYYFFHKTYAANSLSTMFFGLALSFTFVFSFFAFARAVKAAGTALASLSARLSVMVPVILSIFIYRESPTTWQVLGLLFVILTILTFTKSSQRLSHITLSGKDYFFLAAVLIGIGINDFSMKIFQQIKSNAEKPFFLLCIFSFSFILTTGYAIVKKISFERSTAIRGLILGIPNVFSTYFLLGALARLPGIIVFPAVNVGIILSTALFARIIFGEKLNKWGVLALFLGMIAVGLLSI